MSGPTPGNPLDVCGVVVTTCIGNDPRKRIQNLSPFAAVGPKYKESNLIQRHTEAAAMRKERSTTSSQRSLLEDVLL
jgi:hypothetical protein